MADARTELRALEHEILGVVTSQHRETRRGTTPTIIKAALGARSANDRVQIDRTILRLLERGLLARVDMALLPAAAAGETAAGTADRAQEKRPAAPVPDAADPAPATTTRAPAVDAAVVRRLRAEVDRLNGVLVLTQVAAEASRAARESLMERCAAMQMALMEDAWRRYAAGDPEALGELDWLQVTGEMLLEHSASFSTSIAASSAEPVAQTVGGDA